MTDIFLKAGWYWTGGGGSIASISRYSDDGLNSKIVVVLAVPIYLTISPFPLGWVLVIAPLRPNQYLSPAVNPVVVNAPCIRDGPEALAKIDAVASLNSVDDVDSDP